LLFDKITVLTEYVFWDYPPLRGIGERRNVMGKPADPTILLVESILDTGKLDQVFGYLRMTSDKQFIITDYTGKICASSQGSGDDPPDDRYIDLPPEDLKDCLRGLVRLYRERDGRKPTNFAEWIDATFGEGIARVFMRPYNLKVWGYPLERLGTTWVGERVAIVDLERVLCNIVDNRDDVSWGPNNTFRFPRHGGTGAVWRACAARLPQQRMRFGARVVEIDAANHTVFFADGTTEHYDLLLSTMPLNILTAIAGLGALHDIARGLCWTSTHIFGIGLRGTPPEHLQKKCWMYFPEPDNPFYRVTVFSNYSPNNVPDISRYWSLMAEVSESPYKPVPPTERERIDEVIRGMLATRLISSRDDVVDVWYHRLEHGYPTPTLERDSIIYAVLPALEDRAIFSRGRFGAWRYEVSNQDHSLMQGVEWVDRILSNGEELTLWHPDIVNSTHRPAVRKS